MLQPDEHAGHSALGRRAQRRRRHALEPVVAGDQVGAALADVGDGSQALGDHRQKLPGVEGARQLGADLVEQRRTLGAAVELTVQARVDDRLPRHLAEPAQQVQLPKGPRLAAVERRGAHDLGAVDERDDDPRAEAVLRPALLLQRAGAEVRGDVLDHDRTAGPQRLTRQRVVDHRELLAGEVLLGRVFAVHRDQNAQRLLVHSVDVAGRRPHRPAHPARDGQEHALHVERRAELEAALHERAQIAVAPFQAVAQIGVLHGAGDKLAHPGGELDALLPIARMGAEEIDEADRRVLDHEGDAELAAQALREQRVALLRVEL